MMRSFLRVDYTGGLVTYACVACALRKSFQNLKRAQRFRQFIAQADPLACHTGNTGTATATEMGQTEQV